MTRRSAETMQRVALSCWLWITSAATGLAPIADGDVFWHMAAGREIWRSRQLLRVDVFSIGAAGRPWTDVHWLFQLGVFGIHACSGLTGLVLAKCALVGSATCLLLWSVTRSARALTALGLVTTFFCARHLLLVRPVIVTLVMLGLFCALLERNRSRRSALWILPLAQVVWSNCQGLSVLGPALVAAYGVSALAQRRLGNHRHYPFATENACAQPAHVARLFGCLAACLLACIVTPFGANALSLPWQLLGRLAPGATNPFQQVAENVPSFVLERASAAEVWHFKWFLALLALSIAARRGRVLLSHVLLLIGFSVLALAANRNLLLLYAVATPICAQELIAALRLCRYKLQRKRSRSWAWKTTVLSASVLLSGAVATAAAHEPQLSEPTPFHMPVESTAAIAAHGGEGRIFSADHHGGYLIWKLYPAFRPYFDTRWILRTPEELEDYLALADEPTRVDAFAAKQAFAYAVFPVAYPSRYLPLVAHLYRSARWRLVFSNGSEVLFANSELVQAQGWNLGSDSTTDHILGQVRSYSSPELQQAARMQLAMLDIAVGEHQQAERALQGLTLPAAKALRAQARLLSGDLTGAEQLAQQHTDDASNLALRANIAIRRQQLPAAFSYLRRAIALDPFDEEVTRLLRSMGDMKTKREAPRLTK